MLKYVWRRISMKSEWLTRYVRYAYQLIVVTFVSGCAGPYDSTVSGIVRLDGATVPRGTVAYHPTAGGPAGYARVDEDGSYTVKTGREEGLPAGDYQVTVVASEPPAAQESEGGGPPPPGRPITPPWYRSKDTSGLKFTVEPGDNEINLELTTKPPAGWKPPGRR
jgi:hypothetical protein